MAASKQIPHFAFLSPASWAVIWIIFRLSLTAALQETITLKLLFSAQRWNLELCNVHHSFFKERLSSFFASMSSFTFQKRQMENQGKLIYRLTSHLHNLNLWILWKFFWALKVHFFQAFFYSRHIRYAPVSSKFHRLQQHFKNFWYKHEWKADPLKEKYKHKSREVLKE